MQRMKEKNNKGFSLVELIVVILIMAIIAVALAPQVMKWVGKSKQATDNQTLDTIKSTAQLSLTNTEAYKEALNNNITIKCNSGGTKIDGHDCDSFEEAFKKNLGSDLSKVVTKSGAEISVMISASGGSIVITSTGEQTVED